MSPVRNRRTHHRLPCTASVKELSAGGVEARATNISAGGMYLQRLNGEPLRGGELLHLSVALSDDEPVRLVAQVVAPVTEVFYEAAAVRFLVIEPLDVQRIERMIERRTGVGRGLPLCRIQLKRPERGPGLRHQALRAQSWMPCVVPKRPLIAL